MKILDWYIIRNFITTLFAVLLMFAVIAVIFDISEKIDDFIEKDAPVLQIFTVYYLNFIPYLIDLISPLLIFISAVYFTSRMSFNSEILSILASGVSFYRLLVPYLIVATVLTGISYYLKGWVIPKASDAMVQFEITYLSNPYNYGAVNIHRQVSPGNFMYLESYDNPDSTGYKFTYEEFEGNELNRKVSARMVKWEGKQQKWLMHDWVIRNIDGLEEDVTSGDTMLIDIGIAPGDFDRKTLTIPTMTTTQLTEFINLERMRGEERINLYIVEREKRTSVPFATFVLVIIAVAVSSRKLRGGIGTHLGFGLLIAFSYLLVLQFSSTFAVNTSFPAWIAVWIPNAMFGVLGVFLLFKAPK
ncbi:MAG: LptF/LptG family permease [Bacteroidia bacterium]